jgi:phage tail-like protein
MPAPQFSANAAPWDPYRNYRFKLKWNGDYVAGISKMSALTRATQIAEHPIGGAPRVSSGQSTYAPIVLERGVTYDTAFEQWANKVWDYSNASGAAPNVALDDFRKDIIIELYNAAGQKILAYAVHRCWVSQFQAMPDLDAGANAVAIQTLILQNEGWDRD